MGPELSPQQCGGHDQELAFPMEGMRAEVSDGGGQGGGYQPSPRAEFESSHTSLGKVLSLTVPQCPHL